jgi:conjugal transfer pilus assembly protein TraV
MRAAVVLIFVLEGIIGCSTMSGLSGQTSFSCPAAAGIKCGSVSSVYEKAVSNSLPTSEGKPGNGRPKKALAPTEASTVAPIVPAADRPTNIDSALRSEVRTLRVWIAPFEDADGDLHDQQFVYLVVDPGRWLIEHHERRIREVFGPVRAPHAATSSQTKIGDDSRSAAVQPPSSSGYLPPESKPGAARVFPLKDFPNAAAPEEDHVQ